MPTRFVHRLIFFCSRMGSYLQPLPLERAWPCDMHDKWGEERRAEQGELIAGLVL